VGDFYETVGFDAVLMVQYAGLNPMGQKLPKAGCPKQASLGAFFNPVVLRL
jgi:hypothetical protein